MISGRGNPVLDCGVIGKPCVLPSQYLYHDPRDTTAGYAGVERIQVCEGEVGKPDAFLTETAWKLSRKTLGPTYCPNPRNPFFIDDPATTDVDEADEVRELLQDGGYLDKNGFLGLFYALDLDTKGEDGRFSYAWYAYREHLGPEKSAALYGARLMSGKMPSQYDREGIELHPNELEALIHAGIVRNDDAVCEPTCPKDTGEVKDGKPVYTKGTFYFVTDGQGVRISNEMGTGILDKLRDEIVTLDPDDISAVRRSALIKEFERLYRSASSDKDFREGMSTNGKIGVAVGIASVFTAIITAGIFTYFLRKQTNKFDEATNKNAELAGSKVKLEDLVTDRTAELKAEFREKGGFDAIYRDNGILDRFFETTRNPKGKNNNASMLGETDSGKSFSMEAGVPEAVVVEEHLLGVLESQGEAAYKAHAARLEEMGYPRIPEKHRAWAYDYLRKGRAIGEPGIQVYLFDMRKFNDQGAVWSKLDDKMIQKFLRPFEEKADKGIKVYLYIDESKEAGERHRSAGEEEARSSLLDKLKKAAEVKNLSLVIGTTPEEFIGAASNTALTVRYMGIHIKEATPADLTYRLRSDPKLASEFGVRHVSDSAMMAINLFARELKPTASYNASSSALLSAVAQHAQYRGVHDITWEFFRDVYWPEVELPRRGPMPDVREADLPGHIAEITSLIDRRNEDVREIVEELNLGNAGPEVKQRFAALRGWRYAPWNPRAARDVNVHGIPNDANERDVLVQLRTNPVTRSLFMGVNDTELAAKAHEYFEAWRVLLPEERIAEVMRDGGHSMLFDKGPLPLSFLLGKIERNGEEMIVGVPVTDTAVGVGESHARASRFSGETPSSSVPKPEAAGMPFTVADVMRAYPHISEQEANFLMPELRMRWEQIPAAIRGEQLQHSPMAFLEGIGAEAAAAEAAKKTAERPRSPFEKPWERKNAEGFKPGKPPVEKKAPAVELPLPEIETPARRGGR